MLMVSRAATPSAASSPATLSASSIRARRRSSRRSNPSTLRRSPRPRSVCLATTGSGRLGSATSGVACSPGRVNNCTSATASSRATSKSRRAEAAPDPLRLAALQGPTRPARPPMATSRCSRSWRTRGSASTALCANSSASISTQTREHLLPPQIQKLLLRLTLLNMQHERPLCTVLYCRSRSSRSGTKLPRVLGSNAR